MKHVVVLGAGLQGACAALALARAGHRVTLIERERSALTRASLRNEGKIHLGFVYANDPTSRTTELMLESALAFGPRLEEWIGPIDWRSFLGRPFTYLILRDSIVAEDTILAAWHRIQTHFDHLTRGTPASYLGLAPRHLWSTVPPPMAPHRFGARVARAIDTAELALDMTAFRTVVAEALTGVPTLECRFEHDVREVRRTTAGFRIEGSSIARGPWSIEADLVVNCLWEGRLAVDRQLDVLPTRPWVYRLKYRLLGQLPGSMADVPSLTLMLGKYGDVVNFGDGRVYLSWYPACLRGWSGEVSVPDDWDRACRETSTPAERHAIARESLAALDDIMPGLAQCQIDSVAAGVIFSWGDTDIDDLASELHRRDDIGPACHDGYITVNTGKLTTAPAFAARVVELVG